MDKANKGEWSEIYCILRILAERKIYIADGSGKKHSEDCLNVLELMRKEAAERVVRYHCSPLTTEVTITVDSYTETLPVSTFLKLADTMLLEIKKGKGTFALSESLQREINETGLQSVKAASRDKNDVYLTILDPRSGVTRKNIGFSIKSEIGKAPTLFNTGTNSALVYELDGMTPELMDEINSIFEVDSSGEKFVPVMTRFQALANNGVKLTFAGFPIHKRKKIQVFCENLEILNPRLPLYFDTALRGLLSQACPSRDVPTVTDYVSQINPAHVKRPHEVYEYMIKSFLYAAYCGLTAGTLWNGKSNVNGGFIRVAADGEVLAFYALESDSFKQYLFDNSLIDLPATDKSHGNYAEVYEENGKYYFRLNFQIRYSVINT